jgi:acyl carrier protein
MEDRIKNVMSAVFEIPADQICNESSSDTIATWDSLKHMNLIIALEEEFNISIPDHEVGNMLNFELIFHIINEAMQNNK